MQGGKTEHPYVRRVTELVRTGLSFVCVPSEKVVRYYLITMNYDNYLTGFICLLFTLAYGKKMI